MQLLSSFESFFFFSVFYFSLYMIKCKGFKLELVESKWKKKVNPDKTHIWYKPTYPVSTVNPVGRYLDLQCHDNCMKISPSQSDWRNFLECPWNMGSEILFLFIVKEVQNRQTWFSHLKFSLAEADWNAVNVSNSTYEIQSSSQTPDLQGR